MQPLYCVPDLFFRDFVQADASWAVLSQQAPPFSLVPRCQGECGLQFAQETSRYGASHQPKRPDRSGSCSVMAQHLSFFSGPAISSPGTTAGFGSALAQLPGNGAEVAGQGRLLLASWCLTLPTRPKARPVLCTFSHPDRAVHFGSEHLPDLSIRGNIHIPFADSEQRQPVELLKKWLYDKMLDTCGHLHRA